MPPIERRATGRTDRPAKKPYRRPALQRYGDLGTLTAGGLQKSDETVKSKAAKTRLLGTG